MKDLATFVRVYYILFDTLMQLMYTAHYFESGQDNNTKNQQKCMQI